MEITESGFGPDSGTLELQMVSEVSEALVWMKLSNDLWPPCVLSSPPCPASAESSLTTFPSRWFLEDSGRSSRNPACGTLMWGAPGWSSQSQPSSSSTGQPTIWSSFMLLIFSPGEHLPSSSEDIEERCGQDEEPLQPPGRTHSSSSKPGPVKARFCLSLTTFNYH